MGANGLDEYWVPEHVKDYLRKLGFVLPLDDMEPWIRSWDDWMSARGHSDRKHIIPCLIIHPDQSSENKHVDFSKLRPLKHWEDFWKIGIQIPHQQASKGLDEGNSEA